MSLPSRPDRRLAAIAAPGTAAYDDQRLLLLEILVDPPAGGDVLSDLGAVLDRSPGAMEAAAVALERAGLAERRAGRVHASPAALAFDALWPVCL